MSSEKYPEFGWLVGGGILAVMWAYSIFVCSSGGSVEVTHYFDTLLLLLPIAFFVGVAFGLVLEKRIVSGRQKIKHVFWVVFLLSLPFAMLVQSGLVLYRE